MPPTEWVDDATISDETRLWRRIAPSEIRVDPQTGVATASDSAYRTHQMSVHIANLTDTRAVLANYPNHSLTEFTAGDARAVGCMVVRDPLESDPSHALVCRNDDHTQRLTKSQAKQIANRARWVILRVPT